MRIGRCIARDTGEKAVKPADIFKRNPLNGI